ncbi:MAG: OmpW family outer membrane protein, partial [Pseudomonadota bacterium]
MKTLIKSLYAAAAVAIASPALTTGVSAAGLPTGSYAGDFLVRAGVAGVLPNSEFGPISGALVGLGSDQAEVDDSWVPHLTLTYFLNSNLAVELFCCFAQHGVHSEGALAAAGVGELGETMIFPPALTLQYHFTNMGSIKPYVGAGVQYIHFFDTSSSIGGTLDIDDAFGFVLQGGADFQIG